MPLLFTMMGALLLESCDQVPITDEIFYGNKGMQGAVSFHTLTSGQKNISFEDWMKILRTQPLICSSVKTYGDMKAAFEKICSICNCCSYDTKAKADEFFKNVNSVGVK